MMARSWAQDNAACQMKCCVTVSWPMGYMVAMDFGPEAMYKGVRCVKYERTLGEVNKVLYIPCYNYNIQRKAHGRFWQVQ